MAKKYDWRTYLTIASGGYPGETIGVIPDNTSWVSTDSTSGSATAQYFYRDSSSGENANSSRVVISVTDEWTASIDQRNFLHITVSTTIHSIVRDDIVGSPIGGGAYNVNMFLRRGENGALLWSKMDDNIAQAHNILSTPLNIGTYSFVLEPGENKTQSTIWWRNNAVNHDSDPIPNVYTDILHMGVEFRNPLPANYRPGATLKGENEYGPTTGVWVTHNDRNAGCHVLADVNNMTWKEMRTSVGIGNPPSILTADDDPNSWENQLELGKYLRT